MGGLHAYLPPSGAPHWRFCAMWAAMNEAFPQGDTEDAATGTAAHWVFEQMFYARPVDLTSVAANGVPVTQEMLDGAALYVRVVDADLAALGLDRRYLVIERPVAMPTVHAQNWGTPDTWFG